MLKQRQTIKQCLNNDPVMKICFQIIFEFTWYESPALTVRDIIFTKVAVYLNAFLQSCICHWWAGCKSGSSERIQGLKLQKSINENEKENKA